MFEGELCLEEGIMTGLSEKEHGNMGRRKERAVRYFGLFMLFILVCTIVSRGIYAYRMPRVVLGTVDAQTLVHKIQGNGTVLTTEEVPVVTEEGLLVEKVSVVEGQKVAPGDVLFWIGLSDLQEVLGQADAQIKAEEVSQSVKCLLDQV